MSTDKFILDEKGNAIPEPDLLTWARWYETAERSIANDELPDGVRVSTVFLGMDHSFVPDGHPVLFETMIFHGEHDTSWMMRYETREQAIAGHAKALAWVKGEGPEPE